MKFSKRERFLIGLLLFVLLWTLAFKFAIGPAYEEMIQTREDLMGLQGEKNNMDLYLDRFSDLKEKLKEMGGKEEEKFFYRDIDDAFMDQHLQDIAGRSGVEIVRMSINGPSLMEEEGIDDSWAADHVIMQTAITMEVSCPGVEQIKAFADEVYHEPTSLFINYIDMKVEDGDSPSQSGKDGNSALRGIMEVWFYYEKTE